MDERTNDNNRGLSSIYWLTLSRLVPNVRAASRTSAARFEARNESWTYFFFFYESYRATAIKETIMLDVIYETDSFFSSRGGGRSSAVLTDRRPVARSCRSRNPWTPSSVAVDT